MQESFLSRTEKLIGSDNVQLLNNKTVAIFGLGGVGSYVAESLARCGIGNLILVDNDVISESNINRQLYALHSTIGKKKTEVAKERILDINPSCLITTYSMFYLPENSDKIDLSKCDYIIDAIDTITAKICLIEKANSLSIPIICSMGTGNKLNPFNFHITDIYKTSVCPLARVMRTELKKRKIKSLKVLFSDELPKVKTNPPASISFIPSIAGLMISSEVVKDLLR